MKILREREQLDNLRAGQSHLFWWRQVKDRTSLEMKRNKSVSWKEKKRKSEFSL
jgi:hypothetical protein